jgi:hypothetical protein
MKTKTMWKIRVGADIGHFVSETPRCCRSNDLDTRSVGGILGYRSPLLEIYLCHDAVLLSFGGNLGIIAELETIKDILTGKNTSSRHC